MLLYATLSIIAKCAVRLQLLLTVNSADIPDRKAQKFTNSLKIQHFGTLSTYRDLGSFLWHLGSLGLNCCRELQLLARWSLGKAPEQILYKLSKVIVIPWRLLRQQWLLENRAILSFALVPHSSGVVTNPPNSYSKDGRTGFYVPSTGKRTKTNVST